MIVLRKNDRKPIKLYFVETLIYKCHFYNDFSTTIELEYFMKFI